MSATTSTELDLWQQAYDQLAPEVRERWELDQVKTIRNTVATDLTPAEFQMGLAIAARYELDPLLHEIWFAKGKDRDGRPGRVLIMVGRDGLLRNARRQPDYAGFDSDVVREKDVFKVRRSKDGREVVHEYEGAPAARGKIVGAWAQVYQHGKHETYFFAPWDEYVPKNLDKAPTWKNQPSVMIQKCALSLCLRLAFNLSGVVSEEEAERIWQERGDAAAPEPGAEQVLDLVPDDLRERLAVAWDRSQAVLPGRYTLAAVQMSVAGQDREAVEAYVAEMEEAVEGLEPPEAEVVGREPLRATNYSQDEIDRLDQEMGAGDEEGPLATGSDGSAGAPPASPPTNAPSTAAPSEDVEVLRRRLSGLYDRQAEVEENPASEAETAAALDAIGQEIEHVEGRLRAAGAEVPGQESLGV